MNFQHCAIIGLGLLGGSLAYDLRRVYPKIVISGIARRDVTLQFAANMKLEGMPLFDHLSSELSAISSADLVIICTPVQTIMKQLASVAALLSPGAIVSDVGSTKRAIMNTASTLFTGTSSFIGGHPMAGSDQVGLENSRPFLYQQASWALCVPAGKEEQAAKLAELAGNIGARPLIIDAAEHDELVALTSHLPHVLAASLTNQVLGNALGDSVLPFIAGGFRDTTRIAAGHPEMWRDILLTNRDRITSALNRHLEDIITWRDAIRAGDSPHVEALLSQARERRKKLNEKI